MQPPMMLTASYNLSLSFCQSVVDLLCLGFLSCIPFVLIVKHLFFSRCSYNSSAKMLVSNFQIKGTQGIKFDTKFPFWISFIQSKVFPVTIHLGKLFSWRYLSNWSAVLLCKLLRFLIQYPCTPSDPGLFQFGIFLICFLTFLISICMSSCTVSSPSSFSTLLSQSVLSLCITAWSHISL